MFDKLELARYLKIGSTTDFTYKDPAFEFNYDITFEEAKQKFRELVYKRISQFPIQDSFLYFSGTIGSCIMLDLIKDIPTLSMNLGNNSKEISDYYGVRNYMFQWDNIEEMVMEHQTQYVSKEKPRCWSLDDIYGWIRIRNGVNVGFKSAICEGGGGEWCLFGDPNRAHAVMDLAIRRGEYKVSRAMRYKRKVILRNHDEYSNYLKCYVDRTSIFKDHEIADLGLPIPEFKLREESLKHLTQAAHDWGYHYIIEENDHPAPDYFNGFDIHYLFYDNKEMVDFLISLPMEMKYNLGRSKHIWKETFPLPKDIPQLSIGVFAPIIAKIETWTREASILYLNKDNRIWNYLNYDKTKKYFGDFMKNWQLLNLSIWLNSNDKTIS